MRIKLFNKILILHIILVLLTLITYWEIQTFEFLNYDDNLFIVENEHIRNGFSIDSLVYAFTDINSGIWQPVTWISHIMDCQLFGLNPMGHHWNNLIFHLINSLLVFFALHRMTGTLYRSFFISFLFAVHPIQVESVAWIAERKNVLSTFFYLLCISSYISYVDDQKIRKYITAIFFYILGLMSKPMMVTMPFVLILFDFWPLGRFKVCQDRRDSHSVKSYKGIIKEKIPFLIIAIIFSIISWQSQYLSGAMTNLETISLQGRVELSLVSYIEYIYKLIWPIKLAFFYPYTGNITLWKTLGAFSLLILVSIYSIYFCKKKKHILFGWLWYLVTITPVIGLVHLGDQAMADRYMYIPCVGIFLTIIWEVHNLTARNLRLKYLFILFSSALIIVFSLVSIGQVKTWRDNFSLYSHALDVTTDNYVAHANLGAALLNSGRTDEAIYHLEKALKIRPQSRKTHFDMGTALAAKKKFQEAKKYYDWILEKFPDDIDTIYYLGRVCYELGEYDKAMHYLTTFIQRNPKHVTALKYLGHVSLKLEKYEEAEKYYLSAIKLYPDSPKVLNNLGTIYYNEGDLVKASYFFKLALKYKPDYRDAYLKLKNIKLQSRKK